MLIGNAAAGTAFLAAYGIEGNIEILRAANVAWQWPSDKASLRSVVSGQHPAAMIGEADVADELVRGSFPGVVERQGAGRFAGRGECRSAGSGQIFVDDSGGRVAAKNVGGTGDGIGCDGNAACQCLQNGIAECIGL